MDAAEEHSLKAVLQAGHGREMASVKHAGTPGTIESAQMEGQFALDDTEPRPFAEFDDQGARATLGEVAADLILFVVVARSRPDADPQNALACGNLGRSAQVTLGDLDHAQILYLSPDRRLKQWFLVRQDFQRGGFEIVLAINVQGGSGRGSRRRPAHVLGRIDGRRSGPCAGRSVLAFTR